MKKSLKTTAAKSSGLKKQTKIVMAQALEEDPTVFQYDEVSIYLYKYLLSINLSCYHLSIYFTTYISIINISSNTFIYFSFFCLHRLDKNKKHCFSIYHSYSYFNNSKLKRRQRLTTELFTCQCLPIC